MNKPIQIVGGGLAGLTLGIELRRHGIPVVLHEAGQYPRHRVCGEFISGHGPGILRGLGVLGSIREAGAIEAHTARFICGKRRSPIHKLSAPALCLSRHALDELLAREFQGLGGELRQGSRWTQALDTEGVVCAAGRRPCPAEKGWHWFGLKAHARRVDLPVDLEMHVSSAGYVGVNRIDHGQVNVCGLFRRPVGAASAVSRLDFLRGEPGSALFQRLEGAEFIEDSVCSVGGLMLAPRRARDHAGCRIGDALTLIPPVTGNGMSMAFESAGIAAGPIAAFSSGRRSWHDAVVQVAKECDTAFAARLRWAALLQSLLFSRFFRSPAAGPLLRSCALWNFLFDRTR
jgi:flavin-dependent dehydrogenase